MLLILLAWMLFQLVPLPPALVASLSPHRWSSISAARSYLGFEVSAWLPLSVAPAATLERLLYVIPAMAAFVAAREMGRWWRGRSSIWIAVAPVIGAALLESAMGLAQFYAGREATAAPTPVSGTYVNRNHFAGLLELALPLVVMWAVAVWSKVDEDGLRSPGVALATSLLLGIGACILAAVIGSLSRMGFIATLAGLTTVIGGWLIRRSRDDSKMPRWLWIFPVILPLGIAAFFSTDALVTRFAGSPGDAGGVTADGRVQLWKEAVQVIAAYKWTGTGLGAYQQGLYPFRAFAPALTVDFAHNDFLQVLAELGLFGGVLAMAFAVWILWQPLSVLLKPGSKQWPLAFGLLGSFVAIGLHSLVDFNLYIPANAFALAWLAGVAVSPGLKGS